MSAKHRITYHGAHAAPAAEITAKRGSHRGAAMTRVAAERRFAYLSGRHAERAARYRHPATQGALYFPPRINVLPVMAPFVLRGWYSHN